MSDGGRAQILRAVRRALKARSAPSRPTHLVPQRARLQAPELRSLFVAQAEGAGAMVQSVADDAALVDALTALAEAHGGVPVVAPRLAPGEAALGRVCASPAPRGQR